MVLTIAQSIGIFVGAALTLMMFSFLYKDNFFYKFGEHLYVGISVGYMLNLMWWNVLLPEFYNPLFRQHDFVIIIPMILGLLMLARFIRQVGWLSRTPMAFTIGSGSGLAIPAVLSSNIMEQLHSTITVLWVQDTTGMSTGEVALANFGLWVIFIAVIAVLFYFYFSIEHKGVVGQLGTIGIWFIMIAFGASFGYTVMARVSLFIGRVQFLLQDVPLAWNTLVGGAGP
jgi:hypothetical protein